MGHCIYLPLKLTLFLLPKEEFKSSEEENLPQTESEVTFIGLEITTF